MRSHGLLFLSVIICALLALTSLSVLRIPKTLMGYIGPKAYETKILFVGDVMLSRYVETLYDEKGGGYLFAGLQPLRGRYDAVIGNFEATIPREHVTTKEGAMRFSVRADIAAVLTEQFTAMSLANNHALDFGFEADSHTRSVLQGHGVATFGKADNPTAGEIHFIPHQDGAVAIMGINAVEAEVSLASLQLLEKAKASSTMQIVFIHWGDEYAPEHNAKQESLAHLLIENGADAIIGHHPHVVQDIGWYNNVPIFYSLGNFIFDQYFSEEVQTHLAVELSIKNNEIKYRLIPMTSLTYQSSPRLMTIDDRAYFLTQLAAKSDPVLATDIKKRGSINATGLLADLKNKLMMSR